MKSKLWEIFYSRWKNNRQSLAPGYSVLLMVPGDLPVFFKIAMEVCLSQEADYLNEILVIPDQTTAVFKEEFAQLRKRYSKIPFRLVELSPFEQLLTGHFKNPGMNNWLQFVRGCEATQTRYVLWHDADLFIKKKDFLTGHYKKCVESGYACYGVSQVWDKWYKENGLFYLTSTWELMIDLNWVKSFKPWQHKGHIGIINGKKHIFDITLLPQCLTAPERIGYLNSEEDFIHFNYVIGTYRHFQNSKGPFLDEGFKLLLIRLLVDMYDSNGIYEVPVIRDLSKGLENTNNRVVYNEHSYSEKYVSFRNKFQKLMDSGLLNEEQQIKSRVGLDIFDKFYGYDRK